MANQTGDGHIHVSAFGGNPLEQIDGIDRETIDALNAHAIFDAEQVLAIGAIPDSQPYLEEVLGLDQAANLINRLRETMTDAQLMTLEAAPLMPTELGALEPDAEVRDVIESSSLEYAAQAVPVSLPPSVNHALKMSPIRNQGARGTCVGFAMSALHEFYRRESGAAHDFSEQYLYHMTKQIDGAAGSCGTWAVKAASVLANLGQCREAVWAYNPNLPCNNNGALPANAGQDASGFKFQPIILNPKDVGAIKNALASGCVCEFSIPCYNSWLQSAATRQSGRITMRFGSEPVAGGHAMCLIGYQDDASTPGGGSFILRNSWSTSWGATCPYGAGNGTIPYAYLANDGWEAVTHPVPRRRFRPWDRWKYRPVFGDDGEQQSSGRRTIIIEAGDADIIIR